MNFEVALFVVITKSTLNFRSTLRSMTALQSTPSLLPVKTQSDQSIIIIIRSWSQLHNNIISVAYLEHFELHATSKGVSMVSRVDSLSSRPTQLKALPGGLFWDPRKTPPPRRKIIKRRWYLGQEGCDDGVDRSMFFIMVQADDSLSLLACWSLSLRMWMLRVGTDWLVLDAEVLMTGRTYQTPPCIVNGAQR